jgi:hypothetical protein
MILDNVGNIIESLNHWCKANMNVENKNLGFSVLNIFKKSSNKRSKVSDCITVIGVTQAMLIGKIRINLTFGIFPLSLYLTL